MSKQKIKIVNVQDQINASHRMGVILGRVKTGSMLTDGECLSYLQDVQIAGMEPDEVVISEVLDPHRAKANKIKKAWLKLRK